MVRSVSVLAIAFLLGSSWPALASEDQIESRKALMRANGAAAKVSGEMMRGNIPFDPAVANLALRAFNATATNYGDYFPEGSNVGDTGALDTIWTDRAGFDAALAKFKSDVDNAIASKPGDIDAFKASIGPVFGNCKGCHEKYKKPE